MTKHSDRDNRRFDDEGNTRPAGSNYISVDHSEDGLDRRGFLRCMAWAGTATVWALSGGIPKSFAIGRTALLSEAEKKGIFFAQISDSHIGFNKEANTNVTATLQEAVGSSTRYRRRLHSCSTPATSRSWRSPTSSTRRTKC